jgi:predicted RNA-binding Zn ribbon-like protein
MPRGRTRPAAVTPEDVDTARALAFVNTLTARHTGTPVEQLDSYEALLTWARDAGLLKGDEADRLAGRARRRSAAGIVILDRARALRELLHDTFTATSLGRAPGAATLAALSAHLSAWYPHGRLVPADGTLHWVYAGEDDLNRPIWEIARAATRLLTSPLLARVHACAADDCRWWFLDDTKNGSRRWCDMKTCGNRDKVRRYRARQRE